VASLTLTEGDSETDSERLIDTDKLFEYEAVTVEEKDSDIVGCIEALTEPLDDTLDDTVLLTVMDWDVVTESVEDREVEWLTELLLLTVMLGSSEGDSDTVTELLRLSLTLSVRAVELEWDNVFREAV